MVGESMVSSAEQREHQELLELSETLKTATVTSSLQQGHTF